jgi:hypothetical protein
MHHLAIGHVCKDLTPDGWTYGSTVTFAWRTVLPDIDVLSTSPLIEAKYPLPSAAR